MSSFMFEQGLARFANGQTQWLRDKIVACLVNGTYQPEQQLSMASLDSDAIVAGPVELMGKTFDEYVALASSTVFEDFKPFTPVLGIVLAHDTGDPHESPLLAHIALDHSITTTYAPCITVVWDKGQRGIFRFHQDEIYQPSAHECASSPEQGKESSHGKPSLSPWRSEDAGSTDQFLRRSDHGRPGL